MSVRKEVGKRPISLFIKSFQDLDNVAPIVAYMSQNDCASINIVSFSRQLVGCSDLLNYLEKECKLNVSYLEDFMPSYFRLFIDFHNLYFSKTNKIKNKLALFLSQIISAKVVKPLMYYISYRAVSYFFSSVDTRVLMLDIGSEFSMLGSALIKKAKQRNIRVIGYLHGYYIYTHTDNLAKSRKKTGFLYNTVLSLTKHKRSQVYCDYYLVGNHQRNTWFRSLAMGKFDEKRLNTVSEIGVPRYTKEWTKFYRDCIVTSEKFTYGRKDNINVLFFLVHPKYNLNVDELVSTLNALDNMSGINFVYKPHTRNGLNGLEVEELKGFDATEVSSLHLSEWADIGIVIGSSIGIQLLVDNKPIIVASYITTNHTIFQEKKVCEEAESLTELVSIINNKKTNRHELSVTDGVESFVSDVVYGQKSYNQLLKSFSKEIMRY